MVTSLVGFLGCRHSVDVQTVNGRDYTVNGCDYNWLASLGQIALFMRDPNPKKQANKVLTSFVSDLNKIKSNKHTRFNLANYCGDVINYYKVTSNKEAFYCSYNKGLDMFEDLQRQQHLAQRSANLVTERTLLENIGSLEKDVRSR
ncbi:hypothetical protein INT47_006423 [Mucor saturninus]|uniref:Uncharacterized protein n=1 Tax=Mucor saturninus TaxID=64648 RepID=A0A8H7USB6_9FUNG|nr:hypothetical protein INT47_006423 [Mucor saturninus]